MMRAVEQLLSPAAGVEQLLSSAAAQPGSWEKLLSPAAGVEQLLRSAAGNSCSDRQLQLLSSAAGAAVMLRMPVISSRLPTLALSSC